jgi:drug/metabolite transporter (DMT)-like permease
MLPPWLILTFGIVTISTGSILVRYAQVEVPSLAVAAMRLSIATIILAPIAIIQRRAELATLRRDELILALASGFFLALHFGTWITSLEYTTVASSVVLVTTTPLWVALLAPLILKEPLTKVMMAGLCLALLGSILVGLSDTCEWTTWGLICPSTSELIRGRVFIGNMLALAGAVMACAYVLIGRRLRGRLSLLSYIFVVYSAAAIILLVLMFASNQSFLGYSPLAYLWLVLLAVVPQLLGHSSFNWALGYVSAALVSITLLGEPIGSTLLAYFLLDEIPGVTKIIGAILIFIGILLASRSEKPGPKQAG